MGTQEPLSLLGRLKLRDVGPTHTTLSHPSRFMRLLHPIILILLGTVESLRNQLTMSDGIAS